MYPRFENEALSNSELAYIFGHGKCFCRPFFLRSLGVLVQNRPRHFKFFHLKFMKSHTFANELGALKNSFFLMYQNAFESFEKRSPGLFSTLLLEVGSQQI